MSHEPPSRSTPDSNGTPEAALRRVIETLARDPSLRPSLHQIGKWLLELSAESAPSSTPTATPRGEPRSATPRREMPLRLGNAEATVAVPDDSSFLARAATVPSAPAAPLQRRAGGEAALLSAPSLDVVVQRATLKHHCCRWAIERRRRLAERADFETFIKPRDDELLAAARRLPSCYVWPLDPYISLPDDAGLELASQCYRNLARAAEHAAQVHAARAEAETLERAYALLAEAQSAVRALMRRLELRDDTDQEEAFRWLRQRTEEDQVYIPRHMRLNDPADPERAGDLEARLHEARDAWDASRRAIEQRERLLNTVRYHARRLRERRGLEGEHDWRRLHESVVELLAGGLPPSNVELREALLPIVEEIPESLSADPQFQRVLRELDRFLASREMEPGQPVEERLDDEEVCRARELLRGRVVLLIGGERRRETEERLKRIFDLADLRWITTREHQSTADFEPAIARPETALVLLAIRWASHSFEDVADFCARYGKAFVRLPRGYGANQIAREVLRQASRSLETLPAPS